MLCAAAEIVSTFDHPELVKLGRCDLIEEVMIGEDSLIRFSGVAAGAACTVVVSLCARARVCVCVFVGIACVCRGVLYRGVPMFWTHQTIVLLFL